VAAATADPAGGRFLNLFDATDATASRQREASPKDASG
jgi:hypothetical protein